MTITMRFWGFDSIERFLTRVEGSVIPLPARITLRNYARLSPDGWSPKSETRRRWQNVSPDEVGAATTTITIRSDGDAFIDGGTTATMTEITIHKLYTNGEQWYIGEFKLYLT